MVDFVFSRHASECLTSPARSSRCWAMSCGCPMSFAISSASWLTVILVAVATFRTSPLIGFSERAASRFACTALCTNVKSLDCSPSPKMMGFSSLLIALANAAMTAAYAEFAFCLGPKMLKYLSAAVSRPYEPEYALSSASPATLFAA